MVGARRLAWGACPCSARGMEIRIMETPAVRRRWLRRFEPNMCYAEVQLLAAFQAIAWREWSGEETPSRFSEPE